MITTSNKNNFTKIISLLNELQLQEYVELLEPQDNQPVKIQEISSLILTLSPSLKDQANQIIENKIIEYQNYKLNQLDEECKELSKTLKTQKNDIQFIKENSQNP